MTLALALVLLGGTLAHAQPEPTREPRRRSVTLTGSPIEARIAKGFRTVLVFSVPIRGKAMEVDSTRILVVDTGEKSIIIEPLSEPRPDERWTLRVPLADDRAPEVAEFTLLAHPTTEVDAEIDVARAEKAAPACQAACAPCPTLRAIDVVASGLIDLQGVQISTVMAGRDAASGFEWDTGVSYRAASWVLVDVRITLAPRYPAWRPTGATLTSSTGEARIRWVKVEPDEQSRLVRVLAEADVPPSSAGLKFTLHLRGAAGTPSLSIPGVKLPPAKEQKP